jgi:NAD+ synthase
MAAALLQVDAERAANAIAAYLQDLRAARAAEGALLGLSGGIDSSLLAALAVRALGSGRVQAAYLYDRDSSAALASNAVRVAEWLGISLQRVSIEEAARERGAYDSTVTRLTRLSPLVARLLHGAYRVLAGETPFVSSLRAGPGCDGGERGGAATRGAVGAYSGQGFVTRHRYRREYLEGLAPERNLVLLGAANRSEWMLGWFVDGGVDDLPVAVQPLIGLYKTQVRQLARYLGLPEEVRAQSPSPDMMAGITDEYALGLSYSKIDLVLDWLGGGLSQQDVEAVGVTKREIELVREMNRLSVWKRSKEAPQLVVDGGPQGALRAG